jgi:poly(A) polymerase
MKIPVPSQFVDPQPGTYLVGGCVRDLIQGLPPRDFDIVVSDAPRAFAERYAKRLGGRVFVLGKDEFTVFCVATPEVQIDITNYKGSNIRDDLLNRDFTINALACSLADGRIVDATGGLDDLQHHLVRMVSPRAFRDDPVRLIRAFRIAASMNFRIEPETIKSIQSHSALLRYAAAERIWAELRRILACTESIKYIFMMYDYNVLSEILPELVEHSMGDRTHRDGTESVDRALGAVRSLEAIFNDPDIFLPPGPAGFTKSLTEESRILLKMAILLKDIGKSLCRRIDGAGRIQYFGHAARGAKLTDAIGRRLKMSNRHREWIVSLIRRHQRPQLLYRTAGKHRRPPPVAIGRFFRQCGEQTPHLILLTIAGSLGRQIPHATYSSAMTDFLIDIWTYYIEEIDQKKRTRILDGQDLIKKFNLQPSPIFGTLLRRVEELYLAGIILDRKQALRWVAEQLEKTKAPPVQ